VSSATGWALLLALSVSAAVASGPKPTDQPPQHRLSITPLAGQAQPTLAASTTQAQPSAPQPDARRSGFAFMGAATQAMQKDDTQNPAMLWVSDGLRSWREPVGESRQSCADCHAEPDQSMKGVAARYPAWDEALGRPVSLGHRINLCRERHQHAPSWSADSEELLGLEAMIALRSRGHPVEPVTDPRMGSALQEGRTLFSTRIGQIALSCADCHDSHAGARLGGSPIPEAHPTAYPIFRLQWQSVGSLSRRLQGCFAGVRAEPPGAFDEMMSSLQVFLRERAAGMIHEGPGVRP
jgi:sulfur-oxidizing protein SoxA